MSGFFLATLRRTLENAHVASLHLRRLRLKVDSEFGSRSRLPVSRNSKRVKSHPIHLSWFCNHGRDFSRAGTRALAPLCVRRRHARASSKYYVSGPRLQLGRNHNENQSGLSAVPHLQQMSRALFAPCTLVADSKQDFPSSCFAGNFPTLAHNERRIRPRDNIGSARLSSFGVCVSGEKRWINPAKICQSARISLASCMHLTVSNPNMA